MSVLNCSYFGHLLNESHFDQLQAVHRKYRKIHGGLCVVICAFGTIVNVLNIMIFMKPKLRNAVSFALVAIAVCDIFTMLPYFIYALAFYGLIPNIDPTKFSWVLFLEFHMILTNLSHSSNLWLSVLVAYIRLQVLSDNERAQSDWLSVRKVRKKVYITLLVVWLVCIPSLTTAYPKESPDGWLMVITEFNLSNGCVGLLACLWSHAIFLKIAPCLCLAICVALLVQKLRAYEKRGMEIRTKSSKRNRSEKTTIILLCLVFVSLVTELPQSAVSILYGLYPYDAMVFYALAGDFLDLLSLINSTINFFFYLSMNTQYRQALFSMFGYNPALSEQDYTSVATTGRIGARLRKRSATVRTRVEENQTTGC